MLDVPAPTALVSGVGWAAQASDSRASVKAAAVVDGYQVVNLPNATVPNFQRRTVFCPPAR